LSIPFSIFFFVLFDKNIKVCYSSLNTNWRCAIKRKIIVGFLSLALILFLVIPTACVAKRDTDSSPASSSSSSIEQDITTLRKDVKDLQSKIASLPTSSGSNYDADIEALQSDIDNIYTEIESLNDELYSVLDEIETMLADWEEEQQATADEDETVSTITKWYIDAQFEDALPATLEINDYVSVKPSRIEENDIYRIEVDIEGTGEIDDNSLIVTLTPRTKDTSIDTEKTFLDFASTPRGVDWWTDFTPTAKGGVSVDCRKIEFYSDDFDLKVEDDFTIKLDLDLCYAQ